MHERRRWKRWIWAHLLAWLQGQCNHPADCIETVEMGGVTEIHWCRLCGAYRRAGGQWREPRPQRLVGTAKQEAP